MQRSIPTFLLTAALVPAGAVWAVTHGAAHSAAAPKATPTPTHKSSSTHKSAKKKATTTRTFTGPSEDMQWGPVQVRVTLKNKKIVDVQASAPMERARSAFINEQALPMLKQEVLQAQSTNIDAIGGATLTSEAYYLSLQAALQAAHKAHAY